MKKEEELKRSREFNEDRRHNNVKKPKDDHEDFLLLKCRTGRKLERVRG